MDQLLGWIDYSKREPFGFPIHDLQFAMLQSTTANSWGSKTTAADFTVGDKLVDQAVDEEGEPTDEALIHRLQKMFPIAKSQVLGPDGAPLKR